jgi:hypothetical protein
MQTTYSELQGQLVYGYVISIFVVLQQQVTLKHFRECENLN